MRIPGFKLLRFPNRRPGRITAGSAEAYADSGPSPIFFIGQHEGRSTSYLTEDSLVVQLLFHIVQLLFHILEQRCCFCIRTKT
jgi:hypothetical protein